MSLAVRLSGAGGQGIVLAGLVLAEAAAASGLRVACTQAYGPESRGGASRSDVIVSDVPIAFPAASRLDVLVALTQEACNRFWDALASDGVAVVDGRVRPPQGGGAACHALPIVETAQAITGSAVPANMVALGILCGLTGLVPFAALEEAAARRVPAATRAMNLAALDAGLRLGEAARKTMPSESVHA
jgi:2-oxoglutarate ferredoxin oxidoreductase subunit gamma